MKRLVSAVLVLFVSAGVLFSADLKTYKAIYDDQMSELTIEHGMSVSELNESYKTALNVLNDRVTKAGDLNKIKAVMAEMERFNTAKTLTPEDAKASSPDLKNIQLAYMQNMETLENIKANKIITLTSKFDDALEKLQKSLARQSKLDEATAVESERQAIAKSTAVVSAKSLIARPDIAVKNAVKPAIETKAPPQEASEDATMLLYCDDACDIYHNGNQIPFAPGKEVEMTIQNGDVLAIKAWDTQGGIACGLLVGIKLKSNDKAIGTDTSWMYSSEPEDGWENKEFSDKKWKKSQRNSLDWMNQTAGTVFKTWKTKPRVIWGKGSPVYFRKQISMADFR